MSGRKTAAIPSTSNLDPEVRRLLGPVKETLEFVVGRRPGQGVLKKLDPDKATTKDLALTLNEIIDRLSP